MRRSFALFLGAGIATGAFVLTSMLRPTPAAQLSPAPVTCYAFDTIEQGNYSGFGYYCQFGDSGGSESGADSGSDSASPCYADVAEPALEAILRDECVWADFWEEHVDNVWPAPPPPAVDFDKYVVVAVISGTRPTGCYGMEITKITRSGCGGRTIHVRERVPCPTGELCTDALTNNYHFIKVCKEFLPFEVPVCFEHRDLNVQCTLTAACVDTSDED